VPDSRPAPGLLEILSDETAVFIMSVFRRAVVDRIGGFDERFRTNEDYDFWVRAALAGFQFVRNPVPLAYYRRHAASLSANEVRMVAGILRVYRKTLDRCAEGSRAHRIVARQIARFEREYLLAQVREALGRGDAGEAADALRALRASGGGMGLAIAAHALRYTPGLSFRAYRARHRLRAGWRAMVGWRPARPHARPHEGTSIA
jgi:hypothetical protein